MALCECGCGMETRLAKSSDRRRGILKGQPFRFRMGHNQRRRGPDYAIRDCGYKTPCWIWARSTRNGGYGQVNMNGKNEAAHRMMYEKLIGPIPQGMHLDHLCKSRQCVNPQHLQPVPGGINSQRAGWRANGGCCPTCQRPF